MRYKKVLVNLIFRFLIIGVICSSVFINQSNFPNTEIHDSQDKTFPHNSSSFGDFVPPSSGTWIINENTRVENLKAQINGTIQVGSNVEVEFINCEFTLLWNCTVEMTFASNISFKGFTAFTGNQSVIIISQCNNITFQNIWLRGSGINQYCVGIDGYMSNNTRVFNSTFQNYGKSVYAKICDNWQFKECVFEQTNESQNEDGELQITSDSRNFTFQNNTFRNMTYGGIELRTAMEILVYENIFIGQGGIFIDINASYVQVLNNTFINSSVVIQKTEFIYVESNNFQNSWISSFYTNHSIFRFNWFDFSENMTIDDSSAVINVTKSNNYFRYQSPSTNSDTSTPPPSSTTSEDTPKINEIDGIKMPYILAIFLIIGSILIPNCKKRIITI